MVPVPGAAPALPVAAVAPPQWGISVSPSQVIAPVGSEVIMIATVTGYDGRWEPRQRVEWMLSPDGAGQFVSPGERGPLEILNWMHGLPKKVDNRFAVNKTFAAPMTLDRGTPTPTDDVLVQIGQSWTSVTSPTEGTSHVTVFAPEVYGWDRRQQTASIYWVDAQWRFPAPAMSPAGSRHALATNVTRQTDNSPLVGWLVRYTITGGPEAGFAPDGAASVEVVTGVSGEAIAEIFQKQPTAGTNQVSIQVIRPAGPAGQNRPLAIGAGSTLHTWTTSEQATRPAEPAPPAVVPAETAAAQLDVTISGPEVAVVGSDVHFEIQVVNRGNARATRLVVTNRFDAGLEHARSSSPVEADIVDLPPGGTSRLNVTFRVTRPGQWCQEITVTGERGLRATARGCVTANEPQREQPAAPGAALPAERPGAASPDTAPGEARPQADTTATSSARLSVKQSGPDRKQVGETALFTIEVTNLSDQAIENFEIADNFETTLQPARATEGRTWLAGGALGWQIARLEPGKTIRRAIEFTCLRETSKSCNRVTVTAPGMEPQASEACLEIVRPQTEGAAPAGGQPQIDVTVAETADPIKVGTETTFQILVSNKSQQSAFDVTVTATFGNELRFEGATTPLPERPRIMPGEVRFPAVRELRAGENPLNFELRFKGQAPGAGRLHVEVTSRGQAKPITAEQTTEVLP